MEAFVTAFRREFCAKVARSCGHAVPAESEAVVSGRTKLAVRRTNRGQRPRSGGCLLSVEKTRHPQSFLARTSLHALRCPFPFLQSPLAHSHPRREARAFLMHTANRGRGSRLSPAAAETRSRFWTVVLLIRIGLREMGFEKWVGSNVVQAVCGAQCSAFVCACISPHQVIFAVHRPCSEETPLWAIGMRTWR